MADPLRDDLALLVDDTDTGHTVWDDDDPFDPAAWEDWLACLRHVRSGAPLRTERILPI